MWGADEDVIREVASKIAKMLFKTLDGDCVAICFIAIFVHILFVCYQYSSVYVYLKNIHIVDVRRFSNSSYSLSCFMCASIMLISSYTIVNMGMIPV